MRKTLFIAAIALNAGTLPTPAQTLSPLSATNAPYAPAVNVPQVNVPQVNVPQANRVEIPSATAPPPATLYPPPRGSMPLALPPTANQMAPRVLQFKAPTFPETPATGPQTLPAAPTGPTPVAPGATDRWARVAAPLPVTAPVMFNTPAADAILAGLPIFPADNPWHQIVTNWPVHPNSPNIIAGIGSDRGFTYNLDMSFILVPPDAPRANVWIIDFPAESDKGPYPLPEEVPVEGWPVAWKKQFGATVTLDQAQRDSPNTGGDRHAIVVDPANHRLYEFYRLRKTTRGWTAGQASVFDLSSNRLRPEGWTSADAAGLPIFPAVVRYDELARGVIGHALRVTVPQTRRDYVFPARHFASAFTDSNLPRMGERLRLRAEFDETGFDPKVRVILTALKQYGMFVADNGALFAISIAPDERMPASLGDLNRLKCSDFEVVTGPR